MTATLNQWLGDLHNLMIADIFRTVLQWVSLHKAQGLVYVLMGALAALSAVLHKSYQLVLDKSGCEIQIRGEDPNAEYVAAWVKQHFNDRLGTNQTAETCVTSPSDSQRKCHQNANTGYWRFDHAYSDLYTSYTVGYGSHLFFHQGRLWMYKRSKGHSEPNHSEVLSISCMGSWSPKRAQGFIEEAKRDFLTRESTVTQIFMPATKVQRQKGLGDLWTCVQEAKLSRNIATVDLEDGVKEDIIGDMNLFLSPEQHQNYISKGIRYGRNYLLCGPPGTGKTALIDSLSGIFGLPIYRASLSSPELADDDLIILISRVPSRCFVIFEDIDQAGLSTRRIANYAGRIAEASTEAYPQPITLSGFLNAIDGLATPEGPIVIFTTNCPEALDPAIVRPGRVDKVVKFGLANRSQIKSMYLRMYLTKSTIESALESKAQIFADKVRDRSLSPASIQGFLLGHQSAPDNAVAAVEAWQEEQLAPATSVDKRLGLTSVEGTQDYLKQTSEVTGKCVSSTEEGVVKVPGLNPSSK